MQDTTKRTIPLSNRLAQLAAEARRRAEIAPPGVQRESLLKAARLSETASHIHDWISLPGPKTRGNGKQTLSAACSRRATIRAKGGIRLQIALQI
ncbi:hypothetical protein ACIPUD_35720 [Bradyrhizobium sp. CAR08]